MEYWYERNEHYYDPEKQRKYVIKWMEEIKKMIKSSNKSHAIRCLNNQGINVNETSNTYLQQRNMHLLQVYEKSDEMVQNLDMRMFLKPKDKSKDR